MWCCCPVPKSCPTLQHHGLQQARLPSTFFTLFQSLLKLMPIDSVMLSNHLILCCPHLSCSRSFPASRYFLMSQLFASGGQNIGVPASATVLPMNIQTWFPLGLTGLIFLQSEGLSRVFFSTIIWKHHFFGTQPSLESNSHIHTWLIELELWLDGPLSAK